MRSPHLPSPATNRPEDWWATSAEECLAALGSDRNAGLTDREVQQRRTRFGPNTLRTQRQRRGWSILIDQFRSLIILLLVAAAVVAWTFGETLEALAVGVVVLVNAGIGFATEFRAVRSMEALRKLGSVATRVVRDGTEQQVDASSLVPGDIVILEGGDMVTADLRILEASRLQTDESTLTGESLPVAKDVEKVSSDAILAERSSMLYKGTSITRGSSWALVVGTGMHTELGAISALVESAEAARTPLEKRLDHLGHVLIYVTLGIAAFATVSGVFQGKDLVLMIEMGIALAVATVPEGLPIVATIALAAGMRDMAQRNALINRLSSVETLGATTLILTDKTGTLTENRMTVTGLETVTGHLSVSPDGRLLAAGTPVALDHSDAARTTLELAALCNNATWSEEGATGDPTEVALLVAGEQLGLHREELVDKWPEIGEEAFDSTVRMMATYHQHEADILVAVKGAPDQVLNACTRVLGPEGEIALPDSEKDEWLARNEELAHQGLRVLAIARKNVAEPPDAPYKDLTLTGFVAMQDPARSEVPAAIEACHRAGIDVVMVTGDQGATAAAIARDVGIPHDHVMPGAELSNLRNLPTDMKDRVSSTHVFSRVSPAQKLELIRHFQDSGHIVAMTGDGVNDAPALKTADIGVAMGLRGTQVAQDASDMILRDDQFSTIVNAIDRGRVIFDNIRRFLVFLLSCNVSEVLVVGLAAAAGAPLPILPLQLLFLNFVTDVFPALALGVGRGEAGIMERPPRPPEEGIMGRPQWWDVALFGGFITLSTLGAFAIAVRFMGSDADDAVTVSFLVLALAQLWNVLNMRSPQSTIWSNDIVSNPWVSRSLGLCVGILLVALYTPLGSVLSLRPPSVSEWGLILGASLLPVLLGQIVLWLRGRKIRRTDAVAY